MFTGIIEELGTIRRVDLAGGGLRLGVEAKRVVEDLRPGDSISLNGVCLTVVESGPLSFTVEAVEETLRRTTLGELRVGDRVNLERALRLSDRLGGHLVTGHIDGVGHIQALRPEGNSTRFYIEVPQDMVPYLIVKGSVAVDGVSLTVVDIEDSRFSVSIIPFTAQNTTFGLRRVGDRVNIELDLIGKYVARLMQLGQGGQGITEDWLREMGY